MGEARRHKQVRKQVRKSAQAIANEAIINNWLLVQKAPLYNRVRIAWRLVDTSAPVSVLWSWMFRKKRTA